MTNKNQVINKCIEIYYKISFVLEFCFSIPLAIYVLLLKYNKAHTGLWFMSDLIGIAFFGALVIAIIVTQILKNRKKLEKMFLTFAIPIGLMYTIYMMPTYVPDENTHLYRAYQISVGNFIEKREHPTDEPKMNLPVNIFESTIAKKDGQNYTNLLKNIHGNGDYTENTVVDNAAQNYFPTLYIFSSLGLFIGRVLSLNPFITLYLAKVFNFISFLVLGYYTIKIIPFGKLVALTYLMLPMMLHQAASLSADSLTNSVSLLFIAYTLNLIKRKEVMNKKEEVLYYLLAIFVAIAKIAYVPIIAISWLFIGHKSYTRAQKARIILITTISGIIVSLGWYVFSSANYVDTRSYITENGINGTEQLKFILTHPLGYAKVLYHTLDQSLENYIYTFVGHQLGWLNITVKLLNIIEFIILLVISPFLSKREKTLNNKERIWLITVFLGTFLIIFTGLYMGWTTVGGAFIEGIQGRYFIPIVILLLLCMCLKDKYIEFKYINIVYPIVLSILNFTAIDAILTFFI